MGRKPGKVGGGVSGTPKTGGSWTSPARLTESVPWGAGQDPVWTNKMESKRERHPVPMCSFHTRVLTHTLSSVVLARALHAGVLHGWRCGCQNCGCGHHYCSWKFWGCRYKGDMVQSSSEQSSSGDVLKSFPLGIKDLNFQSPSKCIYLFTYLFS